MALPVSPVNQDPLDGTLITEDKGTNTNPRMYEKDNGFVSAVVAVAAGPAAVQIWAVGLAAINPVAGRTAGLVTTVYSILIENNTGAAITAWLEDALAVQLTPDFNVAANDTLVVNFVSGLNLGNIDISLNASVPAIVGQIAGTEA